MIHQCWRDEENALFVDLGYTGWERSSLIEVGIVVARCLDNIFCPICSMSYQRIRIQA